MRWRLEPRDLTFLVEVLVPGTSDPDRAQARLREDEDLVTAMLGDDRLFKRLTTDEETLVRISPWLFFTVLLRRARRDVELEAFTLEKRGRQKVLLFDTDQVIRLMDQESMLDYLATMLASFTRIESMTIPHRVRKGVWRRYRTNGLDVEGLIRQCQTLDREFHFEPYKRIGDVCLFLSGMFPEYIDAQFRYPASHERRPRSKSHIIKSHEDYENHGQAFYRLAAEHERARLEGLDTVLITLSQNFILAEKPIAFLAKRYLGFKRQRLFGI
jgi:hypothetical protein